MKSDKSSTAIPYGMKNIVGVGRMLLYAAFFIIHSSLFISCSENDSEPEEFPDWKATNEVYWQTLYSETEAKIAAGDKTWKIIPSFSVTSTGNPTKNQYIIVHVKEEGAGIGCPIYTDTVSVHYRGHLLPSTTYTSGLQFDSSYDGDLNPKTARPSSFAVSAVVDGFSTALQKMHIGDRWDVYMPYAMGYGKSTSSSSVIPPYSTLIFDLSLVDYWHAGDVVVKQK